MKTYKTYKSLPKEVKAIVDKYPYANDDFWKSKTEKDLQEVN